MTKTLQEELEDLRQALLNLGRELLREFSKILAVTERFINKLWPGLNKEKDD